MNVSQKTVKTWPTSMSGCGLSVLCGLVSESLKLKMKSLTSFCPGGRGSSYQEPPCHTVSPVGWPWQLRCLPSCLRLWPRPRMRRRRGAEHAAGASLLSVRPLWSLHGRWSRSHLRGSPQNQSHWRDARGARTGDIWRGKEVLVSSVWQQLHFRFLGCF